MGRGEKEKREGKRKERGGEEGEKRGLENPLGGTGGTIRACAGRACAPKHAPRFGAALARRSRGEAEAPPRFERQCQIACSGRDPK